MDTVLDAVKTASKKLVHKAGEFIGNKTAEAITVSNESTKSNEQLSQVMVILKNKSLLKK